MVFENASAGRNTGCRSVVNRARLSPPKCLDNGNGRVCSWLEIASGQLIDAVHTRACTGIKKAHNSVTVQNRKHIYMNFFSLQRPRKSPPAVMS